MRTVRLPGPDELSAAERVVREHLAPTPLLAAGEGVWLKAETLQPTGAFKVRGALAALAAAPAAREVVTASAGNHALGMAYAARALVRDVTVVVARTASPAKVERLRAFPVRVVQEGEDYDAAEAHALRLAELDAAIYVSPYNDPHVIAGQRTVALEIGEQLPGPVTIVCPIGGGGLLAGCALAHPARVVGVEVERSRAMSAAVAAGRVVDVPVGDTLADGMAGGLEPGSVTVDVVREHVPEIVAVGEEELRAAIRALAFDHGLVAEGAGAAAYAAILAGKVEGDRLVAIVSGRNITRRQLLDVLVGSA